jgi:membrane protease YdiL (CAAX protease family)
MDSTDSGQARAAKSATVLGLAIALFGIPAIVQAFRIAFGPPASTPQFLAKEAAILLACGLLLAIVVRLEKRPLSSIGIGTTAPGRSLRFGVLGLLLCAGGLAASLGLARLLGWPFGNGASGFAPPPWAMLVAVVRAATAEEIFYRGYAIERLRELTGSKAVAIAVPLAVFAAFHFRQGRAGILIALVLGAILTAMYVRRRDLAANMVTHFLVDFIPNVLLPLLSR